MCEIYGAIKIEKAYEIMKGIYNQLEEKEFKGLIILLCGIFQKMALYADENKNMINFIYHTYLDLKDAKKIVKNNENNMKIYSKEEYLNVGEKDWYKKLKSYKKICECWNDITCGDEDLAKVINETIEVYYIGKRVGDKEIESLIDELLFSIRLMTDKKNIENIKKGFKEFSKEIPIWKK